MEGYWSAFCATNYLCAHNQKTYMSYRIIHYCLELLLVPKTQMVLVSQQPSWEEE
jgi:hypothetical protein